MLRDIGDTTQIQSEDLTGYTYWAEREQRHALSAVRVARALVRPPVKPRPGLHGSPQDEARDRDVRR
jgi:hypothetical protein